MSHTRQSLIQNVRQEDEMRNTASISSFALPSVLCVFVLVALMSDLDAASSGEVAAGIIGATPVAVLATLSVACVVNLVCLLIATRRKEPWWMLSALGIPVCIGAMILSAIAMNY